MTLLPNLDVPSSPRSLGNPVFQCQGMSLNRVWHCFGTPAYPIDLKTILRMLDVSQCRVLPINTHCLSLTTAREGFQIGFGNVRFDDLARARDLSSFIKMININHLTHSGDAIDKTLYASSLLLEPVIKLEVLNPDLATSNDRELLVAVRALRKEMDQLRIFPLLGCDLRTATELVDLGCPILRVMGSPIGSGTGIHDPLEFARICRLRVPVVLDGGVGTPEDFRLALHCGAKGCLVNSMLFAPGLDPAAVLSEFMNQVQAYFPETAATDSQFSEYHATQS